ncbi:MAG: hypothetical protein H8E62_00010 [Planctomycetes bacterium]|nr:hypothetical protein [Planctomycetota bacterium]
MSQQSSNKRQLAETDVDTDLKKPAKQLLVDIHHESLNPYNSRSPFFIARTIARFASLLNNLSTQTADTATKNLQTANKVLKVTWLLFIISILMLLTSIMQLTITLRGPTPNITESPTRTPYTDNCTQTQTDHREPPAK